MNRKWIEQFSAEAGLGQALTRPAGLTALNDCEWDVLIQQGRRAGLLARVEILLEERGLLGAVPPRPRMHLESARIVAENEQRIMRWELNRIRRALAALETPFVLLKGAAYMLVNLPNARGRISSDVDILVRREELTVVENALVEHGWEHVKLEEYDQYYYRQWSHELPPLRHRERGTIIDVHHTILPPTGRLHPDPEKLLAAAVKINGSSFRVLAPEDMVLHSAAHAFQDGDLKGGLRDLVDLDGLIRHFAAEPQFWTRLLARAEELQLSRPLYYALRYAGSILESPVPDEILMTSEKWRPIWPAGVIMDLLVGHGVVVGHHLNRGVSVGLARWLLYIRSHWLRMPPSLLARHLLRKLFVRKKRAVIGAKKC